MHSHTTRISVQECLLSKRATRPFTHWGGVVTRRTLGENKKNRLSHEHSKYEKDGFSVIKLFDQKTVQRILFDSPSLLYHTFRQLSRGFEKNCGRIFRCRKSDGFAKAVGEFSSFILYIGMKFLYGLIRNGVRVSEERGRKNFLGVEWDD